MDVTKLWDKLQQPENSESTFRQDVIEGKVPELPFYIVDQAELKSKIKSKIEGINSPRMVTTVVSANYGNGKTNVLKYLELFYNKTYLEHKIKVLYTRADPDRSDLVVFLLKMLQDNYLEKIIETVASIDADAFDYSIFANFFAESFSEIKPYTDRLFKETDIEAIKSIVYLGTGRLNNKRHFDKAGLEQLKDFNRREILVLFLNILASVGEYVIFAVDEVEHIIERSKVRFSHFLTAYRELVDLFNKVNGHYLILAITDGSDANLIKTTNEALYTRIHTDIVPVNPITKKDDKIELIKYLSVVFDVVVDVNEVFAKLKRLDTDEVRSNRLMIQSIAKIIFEEDFVKLPLQKLLDENGIGDVYTDVQDSLEKNDAFKNIHRKFFDPLQYYLESLGYDSSDLKKQERYFYDEDTQRLQYFIFNANKDTLENEMLRIEEILDKREVDSVTIFSPELLELSNSSLKNTFRSFIIVDYIPEELFILLEIYRENFNLQPTLKKVISNYTSKQL